MSERDRQFQGFAKALWKELEDHPYVEIGQLKDCDREHLYRVIARRAYDLVCHSVFKLNCLDAFEHSGYQELHGYTAEEMIAPIPDMIEWPMKQETQDEYLVDNGECYGAEALEILNPPKEN
jgi:hypothetical protein